jgi:hypothetical protein
MYRQTDGMLNIDRTYGQVYKQTVRWTDYKRRQTNRRIDRPLDRKTDKGKERKTS